jgi:ATP-dependent Clp protease ATP-binding subunit ClpC
VFERFTDPARLAVLQSQEEARAHHHDSIGTGHVLLGLIREGDDLALLKLGADHDRLRQQVLQLLHDHHDVHDDQPPPAAT